ncbi:glycosyltransferase [Alloyangia pacifica]|uniref:glycosyltransferase n=1 Tax=Alloyangia pacifica TaxID=311180 RepID=UPI001CD6278E|nr:glycosyltransferase [Alloyangia pacifica]MCA0998668.1 hypothetical protein [Alloyangia pacifica]
MKILLSTHHLYRWSGSELVTIELAEELSNLGHEVAIFSPIGAPRFLKPVLKNLKPLWYKSTAANVSLTDFDVVYSHHQTATSLLNAQKECFWDKGFRPIFIYNHLSPFEPFEFPGPFVEEIIADVILVNSPETGRKIREFGERFSDFCVFPNPAPRKFSFKKCRSSSRKLERILAVSNHRPGPLRVALQNLEKLGIQVNYLGRPSNEKRIEPEDLEGVDAVIANGKTVQYALRAKCPVFCFDSFGGPGWLTAQNFEAAADLNFSGRCTPRRSSPEELVREILDGFLSEDNRGFSIEPFFLEGHLEKLISHVQAIGERGPLRLPNSPDFRAKCRHEASIYSLITREYMKQPSVASWKRPQEFQGIVRKIQQMTKT